MSKQYNRILSEDERARKGVCPTPQIWVEKSQEYLAKVFGENWQVNKDCLRTFYTVFALI